MSFLRQKSLVSPLLQSRTKFLADYFLQLLISVPFNHKCNLINYMNLGDPFSNPN